MLYQQFVTFNRVIAAGGLTRAAELLNLSQPAVSRQIAALETEMGGTLLEFQGRRMHLTARGEVVLKHARQIEAVVDSCRKQVVALYLENSPGEISIACVTTTGLFTLPSLMAPFSETHAMVRFRVWSGRIAGVIDRVLSAEANLGLVTMPVRHRRLECIPLFKDPVILVAAPAQAARLPTPLTANHLADVDLIAYEAPSRFRTFVDALLEQAGVYPQVAMELESHEAVKTMVNLGYGVALVPESAVVSELRSGVLVKIPVDGLGDANRPTCMLLRKETGPPPAAVKAFVDLVLERYRPHPTLFAALETYDAQTDG